MGDCQNKDLRVGFDSRLKLKFLGSQVTTDAGLLPFRELDEALGLTEIGADSLQDSRLGQNQQHGLSPLLRQSIDSRLSAGYMRRTPRRSGKGFRRRGEVCSLPVPKPAKAPLEA
jgi:hypothetical protein